jgi:hypothetical protein
MGSQIILNEPLKIIVENITITPAEWAAITTQINTDMQITLWVGLIIGAVVGAAGLYCGLWYSGNLKK